MLQSWPVVTMEVAEARGWCWPSHCYQRASSSSIPPSPLTLGFLHCDFPHLALTPFYSHLPPLPAPSFPPGLHHTIDCIHGLCIYVSSPVNLLPAPLFPLKFVILKEESTSVWKFHEGKEFGFTMDTSKYVLTDCCCYDCSWGMTIGHLECWCSVVGRAEQGWLGCILAHTQNGKADSVWLWVLSCPQARPSLGRGISFGNQAKPGMCRREKEAGTSYRIHT